MQEQAITQDEDLNNSSRESSISISSIGMGSILLTNDDNAAVDKNGSSEDSEERSVASLNESFYEWDEDDEEDDEDIEISEYNGHNISLIDVDSPTTYADDELRTAHRPTMDTNSEAVEVYSTTQASILDLLIVYAIIFYVSRCQKTEELSKLRLLRAHQRWGFQTVKQSIERFNVERRKRSSWDRFIGARSQLSTTTIQADDNERRANTCWQSRNRNVHPIVQEEGERVQADPSEVSREVDLDSLYDISMPSESIDGFGERSVGSEHESNIDEESIDIVLGSDGSSID
eukprot:gene29278-38348_t